MSGITNIIFLDHQKDRNLSSCVGCVPKCKLLCLSGFGNCFDSWVRDGTDTCTEWSLEKYNERCCSTFQIPAYLSSHFFTHFFLSQTLSSLSFSSLHYSWNISFCSFCLLKYSQSSTQCPTYSRCSTNIYWVKKYSWPMILIITRNTIKYWKGELEHL